MNMEVIRGVARTKRRGRVITGIVTSLFSARDLLRRFENWASNETTFAAPNGGRYWFPFKGPLAQYRSMKWASNDMWPAPILAYRLAETVRPVIFSQVPNIQTKIEPAGVDKMRADFRAALENWIRNRETLRPSDPIPDAAWDVVDFPYTHESGNVFEAFIDAFVGFFARLNPALALARAAMLSLVSRNYRALATKMAANNPDRVRIRWENWGGNWATLRDAIAEGRTKQPVGKEPSMDNPDPGGHASGSAPTGQFGAWLAAAKPILDVILEALGFSLTGGTPTNDPQTTAETEAAIKDTENTAGSSSTNKGKLILLALGIGTVAVLALASSPNTSRTNGKA